MILTGMASETVDERKDIQTVTGRSGHKRTLEVGGIVSFAIVRRIHHG